MENKKESQPNGDQQKPAICAAIFFSEKVIREAGSGKLSIINAFQSFYGKQFPFAAPPFIVTVSFNNLSGKLDRLKASVEVLDADGKAMGPPISGEFGSDREVLPDDIFDLSFMVPSCSFEKEGSYQILFRIGDQLLGQRALPARLLEQPETAKNSEPSKSSGEEGKESKKPAATK